MVFALAYDRVNVSLNLWNPNKICESVNCKIFMNQGMFWGHKAQNFKNRPKRSIKWPIHLMVSNSLLLGGYEGKETTEI